MTHHTIDHELDQVLGSLDDAFATELSRQLCALQALDQYSTAEQPADGHFILDPFRYDPVVDHLIGWLYAHGLVASGFDWGSWDAGRRLGGADIAARPARDAIKYITAVVRNDRFCAGALDVALNSGMVQACLARIAAHLAESER